MGSDGELCVQIISCNRPIVIMGCELKWDKTWVIIMSCAFQKQNFWFSRKVENVIKDVK